MKCVFKWIIYFECELWRQRHCSSFGAIIVRQHSRSVSQSRMRDFFTTTIVCVELGYKAMQFTPFGSCRIDTTGSSIHQVTSVFYDVDEDVVTWLVDTEVIDIDDCLVCNSIAIITRRIYVINGVLLASNKLTMRRLYYIHLYFTVETVVTL